MRGLDRMGVRPAPSNYPRYGYMLEAGGRPVGVLLTIFSCPSVEGRDVPRCNLSSWHTEEAYIAQAPLLLSAALRAKEVTYLNISPALSTQPIVEAQGFRSFTRGSLLTTPILSRHGFFAGAARRLDECATGDYPEAELIRDHLALGCLCFAVEWGGEVYPFVLAKPRRLRGFLLAAQLLYCRSLEIYARCAGALGRALIRLGIPAVLVDSEDPVPGMPNRRINRQQKRYVYGPHPPRFGDLAYTELAIFDD